MTNPTRDVLGKRLASEAALSSVLEKALLLQRTLLTGKKEPNVAANELAVQAVDQENRALEQEIDNLKLSWSCAALAGNAAMAIVQRHSTRAAGSRGVFEGDTLRDRLRKSRSRGALPMSRMTWRRLPWLFNRRVGVGCCSPCWWWLSRR